MLNTEVGAARDGLAGLADVGWLMRLARQQGPYQGHPAGRARAPLDAAGGTIDLIAVIFGPLSPTAGPMAVLPVRWERLEPSYEDAVLLDGDIALAPLLGHAHTTLTLGGTCPTLPAVLTDDSHDQARLQVMETARAFIASVADILVGSPDPGQQPPGPAWSWLTGQPQTP